MKFRRQVSEPQIVVLDSYPSEEPSSWIGNCWQRVRKGLSSKSFWESALKLATGSADPVINQQCDSNGQIVYSVYDPVTQQQIDGVSESEVRRWLEQRYYQ